MRRILIFAFILCSLLILPSAHVPGNGNGVPWAPPESAGMDPVRLSLIDSTVNASILNHDIPGAVVGVVHGGKIVFGRAYGLKTVVPYEEDMTVETMFDLASVSKCVSTTVAVMQLVEEGKLRLVDQVRLYIPGFKPWVNPVNKKKVHITVQDLLTHSSGLEAFLKDVPGFVEKYGEGNSDALIEYISNGPRSFEPGTDVLYSCFNFIVLQRIVERITGQRLCDYAQANIFDRLGLRHTCYFPLDSVSLLSRDTALVRLCAPTEVLKDGHTLKAEVHDPTARQVNMGNSGNAGVFSNMEDLSVICSALMNGGSWNGKRILSPLTVKRMFTVPKDNAPKVGRALGWDAYDLSPYLCGDVFNTSTTRGHTGYTGTSVLLDLETKTAVIILANRVHPSDIGSLSRMRSTIASIVGSSILD